MPPLVPLPLPLSCRRCGAVLAHVSAGALILAQGRITQPVTLHCIQCGAARSWRPPAQSSADADQMCYTDSDN